MKYISILLLSALPMALWAQKPIPVSTSVSSVTVYPRGAQLEHMGSKFLSAGRQFVVFTGLSSELDASSISVSVDAGVSVLSVSNQVNYLKEGSKPKEVVLLKDSLDGYEFDLKFNQNMINVYSEEKAMILANQKVGWGGQGSEFVIEDLEDLSDFYRDRLADVMLKVMELEEKQKKLNKHITRIKRQLNELNAQLNRATGEVTVEIQVPSNSNAKFTLSYMVRNAGWVPSYNVNVSDVDKPLQISYNAKVFQNCGVDWKDVTLTLTNANPNLSGNKPELHPWKLYFIENAYGLVGYGNKAMPMMEAYDRTDSLVKGKKPAEIQGLSVEYPVNEAVTQFNIRTPHTVPSNGKPQGLTIDAFTVQADYEYYCAPKMDPAAFLVARVSGFEQYDLLAGEANLFLSNTYVGKTYIDPGVISDTLDLSLGRDQSIIVKRKKVKEFTATKKIGGNTRETIGIEISVKNTKSSAIDMVIEDQVPISTDKEIEVSTGELSGAEDVTETGLLRWEMTIEGGQSETKAFRYGVKYPSGRKINF